MLGQGSQEGPQVLPQCQACPGVSSCLEAGEHRSQACGSGHWEREADLTASSGFSGPADIGPRHPPPTSAGRLTSAAAGGQALVWCASLPPPAGPSSWGGGLPQAACRQGSLAGRATWLSAPAGTPPAPLLGPGARISRSPEPGYLAHRYLTEPQRAGGGGRPGLGLLVTGLPVSCHPGLVL